MTGEAFTIFFFSFKTINHPKNPFPHCVLCVISNWYINLALDISYNNGFRHLRSIYSIFSTIKWSEIILGESEELKHPPNFLISPYKLTQIWGGKIASLLLINQPLVYALLDVFLCLVRKNLTMRWLCWFVWITQCLPNMNPSPARFTILNLEYN